MYRVGDVTSSFYVKKLFSPINTSMHFGFSTCLFFIFAIRLSALSLASSDSFTIFSKMITFCHGIEYIHRGFHLCSIVLIASHTASFSYSEVHFFNSRLNS